ncbi:hypothetical protein FHS19_001961 [Paenibacillus rhizosphaerae]|uniref:Uncharacterized protein n=1 Tax=Paenibacillus rhizosphaerae TaxID=297318 RepID=A0A839TRF6_9BACL|nr:hypothetical protein [Paenibacillus rhizosphaerae]MBB3127307.1 hypothetical protein [Paenibacillus rhizosphaerae]
MWIIEHFYWILIIGFAVISALSKRGNKSKQRQQPRGMPTFGGEGRPYQQRDDADDYDEDEDEGYDEDRPEPAYGSRPQPQEPAGRRSSPFGSYDSSAPETPAYSQDYRPAPDYDTGEGVSSMWAEEKPSPTEDTLADRTRTMQREINRVNASLDKISTKMDMAAADSTSDREEAAPVSPLAEQARQGIIWAEILGPPRSKRPLNPRK